MGEGNVLFTLLGIFFLCKTNEEIETPDLLIISTTKLRNVFTDYQALNKNILVYL